MTVYFVDDEPDPVSPAMDELKAKGFKCILKSFEEFNQIFESKREEHGFVSYIAPR